ncbi:retroviral-like aspartic protease family protein, partial [bacterium]|nr:retroviral-like aspartic protease family protein [bacterium]
MVVPVQINGTLTQNFIFDTGIGVNLISKSICEQLHCKIEDEYSGKRMSGQEIRTPMSSVDSLSVAGHELKNVPVGVFDLETMMPRSGIGGFLSLGFFRNLPYSVDYTKRTITFETSESLAKIRAEGTRVPILQDIEGPALQIFMPLVLPDSRRISVEVDTGSQILILNESFMKALGVTPDGPEVKRKDGKDETGHTFSRFFTNLEGKVHLVQSTDIGIEHPEVMFQKIIYDGLVGHDFLSRFRVTYDLPNSEIIFRP